MIDLAWKSVFVGTQEEYLKVLKMAKLQGFNWARANNLSPINIPIPNLLNFYDCKTVTYNSDGIPLYEASEILEMKEMTAREFIERIADIGNCDEHKCSECALSYTNTKCNESLYVVRYWKNNIDEILEIAASGRSTVLSPEEKAIKNIEKLIQISDYEITNEIKESLKLAVEKLKEVK